VGHRRGRRPGVHAYLDASGEAGTRHDIIGILTFGANGKLSGERIYASDELLAIMFGPLLGKTTPI
jgi:hypothetical protein